MTNLENKLYLIASHLYENGGFITKPHEDSHDDLRHYLSEHFFPRTRSTNSEFIFDKEFSFAKRDYHPSLTYLVDNKNRLISWTDNVPKLLVKKLQKLDKIHDPILQKVEFDISNPLFSFVNVSFHYFDYAQLKPIEPYISVQKWLPYQYPLTVNDYFSHITPRLCYLQSATVWYLDDNTVKRTLDFTKINKSTHHQPTNSFYVSARWKAMSIYDDFDFANGSIFKNIKQLQAVYDFRNQLKCYQRTVDGKSIQEEIVCLPNLRYDSVLNNPNNIKNALLTNWKRFKTLTNKISFTKNTALEIYGLKQIQIITTANEFDKVYNWFSQNKELLRQNWDNFQQLIADYYTSLSTEKAYNYLIYIIYLWQRLDTDFFKVIKESHDYAAIPEDWSEFDKSYSDSDTAKVFANHVANNHESSSIVFNILEYLDLIIKSHYKSEVPFHNPKRLEERIQELNERAMMRECKRLSEENALGEKYKPLLDWSKKTKLNIKVFENSADYLREGRMQHNCIYNYHDGAINGEYACFNWANKDNHYTVQVTLRGKQYKIVQIYRTYNQEPIKSDIKVLQSALDEIKIKDKE